MRKVVEILRGLMSKPEGVLKFALEFPNPKYLLGNGIKIRA